MRVSLPLIFIILAGLTSGCIDTGYQPTYIISHEPPAAEEATPPEEVRVCL